MFVCAVGARLSKPHFNELYCYVRIMVWSTVSCSLYVGPDPKAMHLSYYRIAGKFCERKFSDFIQNQRFHSLGFAILFKISLVPLREYDFAK